ncbi:cyanophycin synthetase [Desulforhopalus sp. 52FAK]
MKAIKRILYRWIDQNFLGGCSSYNSLDVRKSCRSKLQAREMFAAHDIPHAKGTTFFNPFTAVRFAKEHGFPLVVKPNVSGFSRGSHFPITNYAELWRAMFFARAWWPISVVEQYLEGKNYRVVVVEGKIMSVIQRYPPFVDGDGSSTITSLIDKENEIRKEMKLAPTIHYIEKSPQVISYLKKQGLSLSSVVEEGERVYLFHRVALAPGGVVEIVDKNSLPPENVALFTKVLSLFNANIFGIDAIFDEGIDKSYKEQKCIFLEVNSRPYLKMHDVPRYGEKEDLSADYERLSQLQIDQKDIF